MRLVGMAHLVRFEAQPTRLGGGVAREGAVHRAKEELHVLHVGPLVLEAGDEIALGLRCADRFGNPTLFEVRLLEVHIDEIGTSPAVHAGSLPPTEYSVRALTDATEDTSYSASHTRSTNQRNGRNHHMHTCPRDAPSWSPAKVHPRF